MTKKTEFNEEEWRKKNLCITCKEKDICNDGKKRNYGSIIIDCTNYNKDD